MCAAVANKSILQPEHISLILYTELYVWGVVSLVPTVVAVVVSLHR